MSADMSLVDWLEERRQNALRISKTKRGDDRLGWLEDVAYFEMARNAARHVAEAYSDQHQNVPLRMHIALKVLRAWNHGTAGYNSHVVGVVNEWIDNGQNGPVPWPDEPFFAEWAEENGFSRIDDYIGFRLEMRLML